MVGLSFKEGNSRCRVFIGLLKTFVFSGVASAISQGDIFIYSCSVQLISFEVDSISKEINCAEHEYMNMSPTLIALATQLFMLCFETVLNLQWLSEAFDIP